MQFYYLSLTRELCGYYVLFKAPNAGVVRAYAAKYYGRIWCSVYTQEELESIYNGYSDNSLQRYPIIVNINNAEILYDEEDI